MLVRKKKEKQKSKINVAKRKKKKKRGKANRAKLFKNAFRERGKTANLRNPSICQRRRQGAVLTTISVNVCHFLCVQLHRGKYFQKHH